MREAIIEGGFPLKDMEPDMPAAVSIPFAATTPFDDGVTAMRGDRYTVYFAKIKEIRNAEKIGKTLPPQPATITPCERPYYGLWADYDPEQQSLGNWFSWKEWTDFRRKKEQYERETR